MKYIQDENTNTLIFYFLFWIAVAFLIVKWDLYEKRKIPAPQSVHSKNKFVVNAAQMSLTLRPQ
jgi:hypothetical protein